MRCKVKYYNSNFNPISFAEVLKKGNYCGDSYDLDVLDLFIFKFGEQSLKQEAGIKKVFKDLVDKEKKHIDLLIKEPSNIEILKLRQRKLRTIELVHDLLFYWPFEDLPLLINTFSDLVANAMKQPEDYNKG
jgi:hypothetical protein